MSIFKTKTKQSKTNMNEKSGIVFHFFQISLENLGLY